MIIINSKNNINNNHLLFYKNNFTAKGEADVVRPLNLMLTYPITPGPIYSCLFIHAIYIPFVLQSFLDGSEAFLNHQLRRLLDLIFHSVQSHWKT